MTKVVYAKFTVFFEDPFWIGLYEREYENAYEVCKITFGPEPREQEIFEFISNNFNTLRFSLPLVSERKIYKRKNPKRVQREIKKQLENVQTGTKAQQALKAQHEECRQGCKVRRRENKEAAENRKYRLRQIKRKEKHKGH
jgi:hypothetical protein